jgi:hypothetical protein
MKSSITPRSAVVFMVLCAFGGTASAEAFDIRLNAQRALQSIVDDQRQALRADALCTLQAQSETFAGVAPEAGGEALARSEPGSMSVLASDQPGPVLSPPAAAPSAQPATKFGLPYFSFGKLMSGRRNN